MYRRVIKTRSFARGALRVCLSLHCKVQAPCSPKHIVWFSQAGLLKLRVEFRRVMPLVIHDASVLDHGRTVPFAGLYTQVDVRDIAIGLTVSSYPFAVQAHFIFTIFQTPKTTNHLAQ